MHYEWDEDKRARNIFRHEIDFDSVQKFDWATCLTIVDERFDEHRYRCLGFIEGRLHALVYTIREISLRIISLRRANKREIKYYENHISD